MAGVVDVDFILEDLDGHGDGRFVRLVDDGVENGLAQSLPGEEIVVNPLETFVVDICLQVFDLEHSLQQVQLFHQGAFEHVLEEQIRLVPKKTDLDGAAEDIAFRIGMEEEDCCPGEHSVTHELEIAQNTLLALHQERGLFTSAGDGLVAEEVKGTVGEVIDGDPGHWHRVPRQPLATQ